MADPLGSLEKVVKLALRIKEAVDTVSQNKEECQQIRTRAVRVSSLLSRLPETGMTADPAMCGALEDLEDSLRRAHALVAACQESTTVCLYCTARKQARRLRRVQDDISQKVMLVVFATNIQTTIILTSIRTGDAAPVAQAAGEMIEMPVADPCNFPANGDSNVAPATSGMTSGSGCWLPPTPRRDGAVTPIKKWLARASIRFAEKAFGHLCYTTNYSPSAAQRKPWYLRPPRDLSAQDLLLLSPPQSVHMDGCLYVNFGCIGRYIGLRKFSLSELEAAAHHFSVENMVGSGSFATVYKGILQDGLVVAIKEFRNPYVLSAQQIDELHLVSINVKHENIAKLIGYGSSEVLERAEQFEDAKLGAKEDKETSYYFVEEYMPNGSLDKIIYGLQLDWSSRFHLIQGIAQG